MKTTPSIKPAYLRTDDAARMMGVAPRTVRDWMRRGVIPYHKMGAKCVLFSVSDLENALARFRVAAVGEV